MQHDSLLVIVPTYHERENLPEFLRRLHAVRERAHVLIVDDASGDGTPAWVRAQPGFGKTLHLIARPGKQGLGTAYAAGFRWALERPYAQIVQMDADLSHDPVEIPKMLERLDAVEAVIGSRFSGGVRVVNWPIARLLLSLAAAQYVRLLTGMPLSDPTGGYKCFRRSALEKIDWPKIRANGYAFQIEITHSLWRQGVPMAEHPITFEGRQSGDSKMSGAIAFEAAWRTAWLAAQSLFGIRRRWEKPPGMHERPRK